MGFLRITGVSYLMELLGDRLQSERIFNRSHVYTYLVGQKYMGVIYPWIGSAQGSGPVKLQYTGIV